jgi:folate-binding protein YgfZ
MLQGIITANVNHLPENPLYSALLTPQGKFLHDFFISEWAGVLYLECEKTYKDDLFKRLMMYRLRADVEITDRSDDLIILASSDIIKNEPFCYKDPRHGDMGYRAISKNMDFSNSNEYKYDSIRIKLGIGEMSGDLTIGKSSILEGNFDELHGVDFKKGCYVGQEGTARIKYRGKIKKRLLPLKLLKGEFTEADQIYNHEGKKTGEIKSISGNHALGLIKLDRITSSKNLHTDHAKFEVWIPKWLNLEIIND